MENDIVLLVEKYLTETAKLSFSSGLNPETVKQVNAYLEQARKFNFSKEIIKVSVDAIIATLEGKK